jgi:hypothetical protein
MEGTLCVSFSAEALTSLISTNLIPVCQSAATDPEEDAVMDIIDETPLVWSGNRNRKLWKMSCTHAALNVRFSPFFNSIASRLLPLYYPAQPPTVRTRPARRSRPLTLDNLNPQVGLPDVPGPPLGTHMRPLRGEGRRRARTAREEVLLGERQGGVV